MEPSFLVSAPAQLIGSTVHRHDGRSQCHETRHLARIIHEPFCCNLRSAALAREAQEGKSVSVSSHARYEIRFTRNALWGDFATNRLEQCGQNSSRVESVLCESAG